MSHENAEAVKQIFGEAIERPTDQRAAYLDTACRGDEKLRARVEALLTAYENAGEFLSAPTQDGANLPVGSTPDVHATETHESEQHGERPGTTIGRYKLLQRIGEGGFGVVYMAEQEEPVRRRVALKIIKLGMDTKQVIARFEAERQALAMMDHPNIARVFDAGATETGRPYFVMELVKGIPVTEYCDKSNLGMKDRLNLFTPVCNAVQHAHQKGIIHRDIKPSNVMVTLHDGKPVPKVIDFGIAKATDHRLTEKTLFTEYRQLVGTPAYMSPEQAEMSGLGVDTRTDIYSLGVLLYELLTGTTPFDAEKLRQVAYAEIQRIIREVEPPKPSTRLSTLGDELSDIARHRASEPKALSRVIRGDLDWIVMKALEKDRTRRYETAKEFATDVEHHLAHEPILAGAPGAVYRLHKFVRRNRVAVTAGSLVAAAILLGLIVSTIGFVQASRQRDRAEANEARATAAAEQAQREADRATLMQESLQEWLVASVRPGENEGEDLTIREMLDEAAEKIESQFADQPEIRAALLITVGRLYSKMHVRDRAEHALGEALEIRCELFGGESLEVAEVFSALSGLPKTGDADIEEDLEFSRKATAIYENLLDQDDKRLVWSKGYEATLLEMLGRWDEWLGILSWGIPLLFSQIDLNEFPDDTRDALARMRDVWEAGDVKRAADTILQHFEDHVLAKVRFLWATREHQEARELIRRMYTPFLERPLFRDAVAYNLVAIPSMLREQGEGPDGREPFLREAVVVARAVHGDDSLDLALALTHLGRLVAERSDSAEAETLLKEAVSVYRNQVGDEHPDTQFCLDSLLDMLRAQGKQDEARAYASELLAERRRAAEHPDAGVRVLNAYAWMLLTCEATGLRDPGAALPVAKRAVERSGGKDGMIMDTLALAYFMTGDTAKAIETQRKALSLMPPEESPMRTEMQANLAKYRQAADAESTDHIQSVPTDTNDDSTAPDDLPGSGG